jgi:hypothetical protein
MRKDQLLGMMKCLDFDIHDIGLVAGKEFVAKKCRDGRIVWWAMEVEGSGFERLFKGSIRQALLHDN